MEHGGKIKLDISWVGILREADGTYRVCTIVNPKCFMAECRKQAEAAATPLPRLMFYRRIDNTLSAVAYHVGLNKLPVHALEHLVRQFNPQGKDLMGQIMNEYNELL
jgi:hypothetical protein